MEFQRFRRSFLTGSIEVQRFSSFFFPRKTTLKTRWTTGEADRRSSQFFKWSIELLTLCRRRRLEASRPLRPGLCRCASMGIDVFSRIYFFFCFFFRASCVEGVRVLAVSFHRSVEDLSFCIISFFLVFTLFALDICSYTCVCLCVVRVNVCTCFAPLSHRISLAANIRPGRRTSDPSRRRSLCTYSARLPPRLQRKREGTWY